MCELLFLPVGCLKSLCHLHCRQLHFPYIPLTTGFQVDLTNGGRLRAGQTRVFLLIFASKEAFNTGCCVCLFVYAVSSFILWVPSSCKTAPATLLISHPMASGSGSSNIYPSFLCPFSPRDGGSFLLLLISELFHHPPFGFLALSLPMLPVPYVKLILFKMHG